MTFVFDCGQTLTITASCTLKQHSSQKDFLSHKLMREGEAIMYRFVSLITNNTKWAITIVPFNKHFISKKIQQEVIQLLKHLVPMHLSKNIHERAKHLCSVS